MSLLCVEERRAASYGKSVVSSPQRSSPSLEPPLFATEQANVLDLIENYLPKRAERSQRQMIDLEKRMALVARVFSKNYELDVIPSPAGGWACGIDPKLIEEVGEYIIGKRADIDSLPKQAFEPKQILYDAEDLKSKDEDEIMGVLRHEVGHANNTDYKLFFKGQRQAFDEGYLPTSWAGIANALEDPWVNNIEIAGSEVVRKKMSKLYSAHSAEVIEKINTQPITRQLGLNIIYYWLTGTSIPTLKNPEVLRVFADIKPAVDKFFAGKSAAQNFETLKHNIWPQYKPLEKKATENEELKELARSLSGNDLGRNTTARPQNGSSPSAGGASQTDKNSTGNAQETSNKTREGLIRRIVKAIKRRLGWGGPGQETKEEKQARDVIKHATQGTAQRLRDDLNRELEKQEHDLQKTDEKLNKQGEASGNLPDDIDLDKLPMPLVDELKRVKDTLPHEAKEALQKIARSILDRKQSEAATNNGSKGMEGSVDEKSGLRIVNFKKPPPPEEIEQISEKIQALAEADQAEETQAQSEARAAQLQEQREQPARDKRERELAEMKKAGFEEDEAQLYMRFLDFEGAMKSRIEAFIKSLHRYLPKKEEFIQEGEYFTGNTVDRRAIARRIPTGDLRIYQRPEVIESDEPRMFVKLIIDNSGSMAGKKMEESLKTAIFWGRVLKRFHIPFSITFFGSHTTDIMKFGQDYDDARYRVKPRLLTEGTAEGGWTDLGAPLTTAKNEMAAAKRRFPQCHGAIFVISDSGANRGLIGQPLQLLIKELQRSYTVMNFILSSERSEIHDARSYFGDSNVVAPKSFSHLPDEAFSVLRITLDRVLRMYQPRR